MYGVKDLRFTKELEDDNCKIYKNLVANERIHFPWLFPETFFFSFLLGKVLRFSFSLPSFISSQEQKLWRDTPA